MSDEDLPTYVRPNPDDSPETIAARLMKLPEHAHLDDYQVQIKYLMKSVEINKGGKRVLGMIHVPMVQGHLKDLFEQLLAEFFGGEYPEFLMVIDLEWWNQATPIQKEAIVFHELAHIQQDRDKFEAPKFNKDGLPVWRLVAHDIEEFNAVVARYGAWKNDITLFLDAARGHS